jgi:hypothetical protein
LAPGGAACLLPVYIRNSRDRIRGRYVGVDRGDDPASEAAPPVLTEGSAITAWKHDRKNLKGLE